MTADQLRELFIKRFGAKDPWPAKFEVDAATYGYCCQDVFSNLEEKYPRANGTVHVALGSSGGLMFKNVELILERTVKP